MSGDVRVDVTYNSKSCNFITATKKYLNGLISIE